MTVTRRAFLAGFGGGVASATLAWSFWRFGPWAPAVESVAPVPSDYADYGGWMLTPEDKRRLLDAGTVRRLENRRVDGSDLATRIVADVDECESWCLDEPDCQAFAFAKPGHPDPDLQNRCWLKNTSELTPVADPGFISGVR